MIRKLAFVLGILLAGGIAIGCLAAAWGYIYITRDLPDFATISDYRPPAVSSVYAKDGTLIAEFFKERRYPVKLHDIPEIIRKCFLAAEDAAFYTHPGIDVMSIFRAMIKNLEEGRMSQGGSTITQQVVKNMLLTPEKKVVRKIKEAILSYRLEKRFTKDEIFEIYLNQIFFGNNAYGIKAAAKSYFHKELSELTLAEGAMLAALPKAPTAFSPLINEERARRRQQYVLRQMVKAGFANEDAIGVAKREKLKVYPGTWNNVYKAPYYVGEVRKTFQEKWREINLDTDGVKIHTPLDLNADASATTALRKGLKEVDKRRGWRGPIKHYDRQSDEQFLKDFAGSIASKFQPGEVYPALIKEVSSSENVRVNLGSFSGSVSIKDALWARRKIDAQDHVSGIKPESVLRVGDVIEVSLENVPSDDAPPGVIKGLMLDQTPDIEGALVLLDPHSGKVATMIGGYSYQKSVFNRVTQSLRQPGSAFKPFVYLSAVDGFKYTPSTIVYDTPRTFRVGDEFWTPSNYDKNFMGPITLRVALEKSRNLVSADIVSRIGIDAPINYAHKLGITSKLVRAPSIALGSSEVTLLELTRAYGVFAARGVLFDSVIIEKVVDRDGKTIYDLSSDPVNQAKQVISEQSAFIMANMMKGVIESGTGYKVKEIQRPVAGKTGTSNEEMDTWFIGYTPTWVCGVWVGFDLKKRIGEKETGGRVAAPIWLYFMRDFLAEQDKVAYNHALEEAKEEAQRLGIEEIDPEPIAPLDFPVPSGVEGFWVDKATGVEVEAGIPGAIYEYYVEGTRPQKAYAAEEEASSYLESPEL